MSEVSLNLTVTQRQLFDVIERRPGLTAAQLAEIYYSPCVDGGPLTADAAIRKMVSRMNTRLSDHGVRIKGGYERTGYVVQRLVKDKH